MLGAMFERLRELQFELYVAKQIKDKAKQKEIQDKITELEKQIIYYQEKGE